MQSAKSGEDRGCLAAARKAGGGLCGKRRPSDAWRPLSLAIAFAAALALSHSVAHAQSLAPPTTFSVSMPLQTQISIVWNDPNPALSGTQEAGYILQQLGQGTTTWTKIAMTGPNVTSWSSSSVSPGTICSYRVKAYGWVGDQAIYSAFSPTSTLAVPCTSPIPPSKLTASALSPTQISLTWQDNANDETGYMVYRTPSAMGEWTLIATTGSNQFTYTDSGLIAGASYNYKVRSYNATAKSATSNVVTATTMAPSGGQVLWSQRFGGSGGDAGTAVAVDSFGNLLVAGAVMGSVDFGGGAVPGVGSSAFIAKYSSSRTYLWAKRFDGSTGGSTAFGVATDSSGNVFVTGSFSGAVNFGDGIRTSLGYPRTSNQDVFIVSYYPTGGFRWAKTFGSGTGDAGYAIAAASNGDVIVTGQAADTDFGCGSYQTSSFSSHDMFLARFSGTSGACQWAQFHGGSAEDAGLGVDVASNGEIVVTGFFQGTANFGPGVNLTSAGQSDIFLARYTAGGGLLWAKRIGGTGDDKANALALDASGNIAIAGYFSGTVDFGRGSVTSQGSWDAFAAKFSSTGAILWANGMGGTTTDEASGVATDPSGNVVVVGAFKGTVDLGGGPFTSSGYWDGFAAKYSAATGGHMWSKAFGGGSDDLANAVAVDGNGDAFVTGYFSLLVDFDGPEGPLQSAGLTDIFLFSVGP